MTKRERVPGWTSKAGRLALLITVAFQAAAAQTTQPGMLKSKGFEPHRIRQGNGKGGWDDRTGEFQLLRAEKGNYVMPFGLEQMDNGEVIMLCSWHNGQFEQPVATFSKDGGRTWTEFATIEGARGRPMMLAYLGNGKLTFVIDKRYFSRDFGRTWPDVIDRQPTTGGSAFESEGNPLIDRDARNIAFRMAELGWHYEPGQSHPTGAATDVFRWSRDGGRTWDQEVTPKEWFFKVEHAGKAWLRGCSEGALVRAANGWIVAALRSDMPPRYFGAPNDDSLEGTGVSISKDNGRTWSPLKILYDAGRHHAHLLSLANGDIIMTLIVRDDVQDGKLASHRRGCEAIVSHDNGLTWDLTRKYILDAFDYYDKDKWYDGKCGHLSSVLLSDGFILTAYCNYLTKAVNLIRWKPR